MPVIQEVVVLDAKAYGRTETEYGVAVMMKDNMVGLTLDEASQFSVDLISAIETAQSMENNVE